MGTLTIQSTRTTPQVSFQPDSGVLSIEGRSSPENAPNFYGQITDVITEFGANANTKLVANFMLEYFNTSTSRCLLDVLKSIEKLKDQNKEVEVNWFYEEDDEDILEQGEDFADFVEVPFNFKEMEF